METVPIATPDTVQLESSASLILIVNRIGIGRGVCSSQKSSYQICVFSPNYSYSPLILSSHQEF
jgi:hypothetical protein